MMELIEYIPVLLILLYIPFVCWSDYKTRTFESLYFLPLLGIGALTTYNYLMQSPPRNYYLMGLTVVLCLILLAISLLGGIGGADWLFVLFIMIFVQYNPFIFPRVFFALDFFWTLLLTAVYLPVLAFIYNYSNGNHKDYNISPPYSTVQMFTRFPGGFPYMFLISFAFVATLILEVFV